MPNKYRKEASSGGRVGYGKQIAGFGHSAQRPAEANPDVLESMKKVPASAGTRETPLPKPVYAGKPMAPKAPNVTPHGTKGVKEAYKVATGENL